MTTPRIDGVVLAGGYSSRMQTAHAPRDKAWLTLGGVPLIEHAARNLGSQVDTLYVSTPKAEDRYRALGTPVFDGRDHTGGIDHTNHTDGIDHTNHTDGIDHTNHTNHTDHTDHTDHTNHTGDRRGPLAGVLAAMRVSTAEWIAAAPCDAPFLPAGWVARLHQAARDAGAPGALVVHRGWRQPVCMVVRCDLRTHLQAALNGGVRKVGQWQHEVAVIEVAFDDAPDHAFLNINTPDELAQAQALVKSAQLNQRENS